MKIFAGTIGVLYVGLIILSIVDDNLMSVVGWFCASMWVGLWLLKDSD